jgi:hypothetical protein
MHVITVNIQASNYSNSSMKPYQSHPQHTLPATHAAAAIIVMMNIVTAGYALIGSFQFQSPFPSPAPLVKFTTARHVKTIDGPACLSNREMTKFHCNQASRPCSMAATALPCTLRC